MIAMVLACSARAQAPLPSEPYAVVLPPQTFQAIVNYLKRQPWEEAQPLMAALAQAAQASAPKPQAGAKSDGDDKGPDGGKAR
jgi:hypothetical protein